MLGSGPISATSICTRNTVTYISFIDEAFGLEDDQNGVIRRAIVNYNYVRPKLTVRSGNKILTATPTKKLVPPRE